MPCLCCHVYCCHTSPTLLVDFNTAPEQHPHNIQVSLAGSNVKGGTTSSVNGCTNIGTHRIWQKNLNGNNTRLYNKNNIIHFNWVSVHLILAATVLASYPGSRWAGKERAWYPLFAHVLNFPKIWIIFVHPWQHNVYLLVLWTLPSLSQPVIGSLIIGYWPVNWWLGCYVNSLDDNTHDH